MTRDPDLPPCTDQHHLFDSTDWRDHVTARRVCDRCPMVAACQRRAESVESPGNPDGTWAGRLYRNGRVVANSEHNTPTEFCGTERGYQKHRTQGTPVDNADSCGCRAAHLRHYKARKREIDRESKRRRRAVA